jgi:hypothetical protein
LPLRASVPPATTVAAATITTTATIATTTVLLSGCTAGFTFSGRLEPLRIVKLAFFLGKLENGAACGADNFGYSHEIGPHIDVIPDFKRGP